MAHYPFSSCWPHTIHLYIYVYTSRVCTVQACHTEICTHSHVCTDMVWHAILPTAVIARGRGIGKNSLPMRKYCDSQEVGHSDYIAHITQRQVHSSTHTHTKAGVLKQRHTQASVLKHTRTQRQAHSSTHTRTQGSVLKHTHEHRGRRTQAHTHTHQQTPVLVLTTDRTGICTNWANMQTQVHTHHMHAHSSTCTHMCTGPVCSTYLVQCIEGVFVGAPVHSRTEIWPMVTICGMVGESGGEIRSWE